MGKSSEENGYHLSGWIFLFDFILLHTRLASNSDRLDFLNQIFNAASFSDIYTRP